MNEWTYLCLGVIGIEVERVGGEVKVHDAEILQVPVTHTDTYIIRY
jgi:hypothetical protein